MQKAFDLIVERLETETEYQYMKSDEADEFEEISVKNARNHMALCYEHSISIVNQVAEEYKQNAFRDIVEKVKEEYDEVNPYVSKKVGEIVNQVAVEYKSNFVSKDEVGYMLDSIEMRGDETWMDYYHKALKGLCELKGGESNDGWIPCEERLPSREEYQKCNGQFIVSDGNRTYATYFDIYDTLKFGEPTIERFRVDKCVIAWQPLPTAYVKGE